MPVGRKTQVSSRKPGAVRTSSEVAVRGRGAAAGHSRDDAASLQPPPAPDGLDPEDPGMRAMAALVAEQERESILASYCGSFPGAGAGTQRLILDLRERVGAVESLHTISRDRIAAATPCPGLTAALCWPRAHLGKDFAFSSFAEAGLRLAPGGTVYCAAKKAKGAKSYAKALSELFGEVQTVTRERGYHVYAARKGEGFRADLARAWLDRSVRFEHAALGPLALRSQPGVFSWRALDAGTAALCELLADVDAPAGTGLAARGRTAPQKILDLCCGVGPLGLRAATLWPQSEVLAIDSNYLAVALAEQNAADHRLLPRYTAVVDDGLGLASQQRAATTGHRGGTDLALVNPPTHAPEAILRAMTAELMDWLAPTGRALFVVKRSGTMQGIAHALGLAVELWPIAGYAILCLRPRR